MNCPSLSMERETGFEPATPCLEGRNSTTELLPLNRIYFSPKNAPCQRGVPASSKTGLTSLAQGYILCARTEGKTEKTIEAVASCVRYLERFLGAEGFSTSE